MKFLSLLTTFALVSFQTTARADQHDEEFAKKAASGGMAEVELGKLAQKSENADVKKFGDRLVTDHTQANKELKTIADKNGWKLPAEPMQEHAQHVEHFKKMRGAEFDREFMKHIMTSHQQCVEMYQKEANEGKVPELKEFANKTVPTLKEHLRMSKEIGARVGATNNK